MPEPSPAPAFEPPGDGAGRVPLSVLWSSARSGVIALGRTEWALGVAEVQANLGTVLRRVIVAGFGLVLLAACLLMLLGAGVVTLAERVGAANALLLVAGVALLLGGLCIALAWAGFSRLPMLPHHTIARISRDIETFRAAMAHNRDDKE